MTDFQRQGNGGQQCPPVAAHIAGAIYLGRDTLTLADAEWLRDELADDFTVASLALVRHRKDGADPYRLAEIWIEKVRLSHAEAALRNAIYRACEWRRCAGWADPYAADERRVCVDGGDD